MQFAIVGHVLHAMPTHIHISDAGHIYLLFTIHSCVLEVRMKARTLVSSETSLPVSARLPAKLVKHFANIAISSTEAC